MEELGLGLGVFAAGFSFVWIFFMLLIVAVLVFTIVVRWKLFTKCGKEGWISLIPIYSDYVLIQVVGVKWWFILVMYLGSFIPAIGGLVSLLGYFVVNYNLALKFKKEPILFGIGLTLLPVIFYAILAFGDAEFTDCPVSSYGPIPEDKVNNAVDNFQNKTAQNNNSTNNTATGTNKFCTNCGSAITSGNKFCPNCGNEIH